MMNKVNEKILFNMSLFFYFFFINNILKKRKFMEHVNNDELLNLT